MNRRTYYLMMLLLGGCGANPLIKNDMIDRWCDDHPCSWEVSGDIERVGSWHPDDYAVELVSDDAEISQLNATVDYRASRCFDFTLIAKISHDAHATLELDFLADGSSEFVQELPESNWNRLMFKISAPTWYKGVRFIIRKNGPGEVILAELAASVSSTGCTTPPIELDDRPDGAHCVRNSECTSGRCEQGVCGGCVVDDPSSCESGMLCGALFVTDGLTHVCVDKASGEFGAACEKNEQCESGHCQNHACSECEGTSCDGGRTCAMARPVMTTIGYWPSLCGPGNGMRASDELCTDNSDCSSHICDGAKYCWPCASSDTSCVPCLYAQVQPGRCK